MFVKISPLAIPLREPLAAVGARDKEAVRRREEGRIRRRVARCGLLLSLACFFLFLFVVPFCILFIILCFVM